MLKQFKFLFFAFVFIISLNCISAGISVTPSSIPLWGTATIEIDLSHFNNYIWFYEKDSNQLLPISVSLDCEQTCQEAKSFDFIFNKDDFPAGNYKIAVFSTDSNEWVYAYFEIVGETCSDGTLSGECSIDKPYYCSEGNLFSNCDACDCSQSFECLSEGICREPGENEEQLLDIHTPDVNKDGIIDFPYASVNPNEDLDNDGILNIKDEDIDGDGILNGFDVAFAFSSNLVVESTIPSEETNEETTQTTALESAYSLEQINSIPFNGYIIELQQEPLSVQRQKLEEQAKNNENNSFVKFGAKILPRSIAPVVSGNIETKTEGAKESLEKDRENFKEKAADILNKKDIISATGNAILENNEENLIVGSEFENVFNGVVLNITSNEAKEIEKIKGVKKVYPNYLVNITLTDSIPLINADDVWQLDVQGNNCAISGQQCLTGNGITIGIIDTGVDYTHEDLGRCLGTNCKVVGGYDFVNNDEDPMDDMGHGTHCAAIAAGNGVLKGVAPDAKIYAYKVLDAGGSGKNSDLISAIERVVDPNQDGDFSDHLDIISLSLGGYGNPDDPVSQAIDNAVNSGVVAVIAAGNSGPGENTIGSPGTARKAITVGAVDKFNQIASFSSRGPVVWLDAEWKEKSIIKPDVVAPGVSICAAQSSNKPWDDKKCLDDNHVAISGTSMATPHVAGAVALLKQKNPDWTPEEIKMALKGTAVDLGLDIQKQGYGRIDILKAVQLVALPIKEIPTLGITSPIKGQIYGTSKEIIFEGVIFSKASNFDFSYSEKETNNWKKDALTLNAILPYSESPQRLAIFNPALLKTGYYDFKLSLHLEDGKEIYDVITLYIDKDIEFIKEISHPNIFVNSLGYTMAEDVKETLDGGFISVGTSILGFSSTSFITKIDSEGNIEWEIEPFSETFVSEEGIINLVNNRIISIEQTFDGNYFLTGFSYGTPTLPSLGATDIYVAKLNQDGRLIWIKNYGGRYFDSPRKILETKDNNLIILGGLMKNSEDYDSYILKINKDGEVIWDYSFGDTSENMIEDGLILQNGNIITISSSQGRYTVLTELDNDGKEIMNKIITSSVSNGNPSSITLLEDGYLITSNADGRGFGFLTKIDFLGNTLWEKIVYAYLTDAITIPEKGFILTGFVNFQGYIFFNELDLMGNSKRIITFGDNYLSRGFVIRYTKDFNYLLSVMGGGKGMIIKYNSFCAPKTCLELGLTCGTTDDGCGGTLNCGNCLIGEICSNGQCVISCLTVGTRVSSSNLDQCCTDWKWITKRKPKFCCYAKAWNNWGCWWNAKHCGTKKVNDYKACI